MSHGLCSRRAAATMLFLVVLSATGASCDVETPESCRVRPTGFAPLCEPALCPADFPDDGEACPIPDKDCHYAFRADCMDVAGTARCRDGAWQVTYEASCVCEATSEPECSAVIGCGWWDGACRPSIGCEDGRACPWRLHCVTEDTSVTWDGQRIPSERSFCAAPDSSEPW